MNNKPILNLKEFYLYAKNFPRGVRPPSPGRVSSPHPYDDLLSRFASKVSSKAGWYFWVNYPKKEANLEYVYIGKAENLYKRLLEEHLLKKELFLWQSLYGRDVAIKLFNEIRGYPKDNEKNNLHSTTHIFFIEMVETTVDNNPFNDVPLDFFERKFISFYEPRANEKKYKLDDQVFKQPKGQK